MTRAAAGLSTHPDAAAAGREAARSAGKALDGSRVDLAFVFLTQEHREDADAVAEAIHAELAPRTLVGCVAQGVVGGSRELESGPGVSVLATSLPDASVETFHAGVLPMGDEELTVVGLPDLDDAGIVILLADPYTFPAEGILRHAAEEHPGVPFVGGIPIGGPGRGEQTLLLDDELYDQGAVGAVVRGAGIEAIVSQGCAPLGRELVVTAAEGNLVLELAGEPALERLRNTIAALSPREQALASRGLLAGLVIDENKPEYGRGDFLMRPIIGVDEERGALALGERVRVGQTLRFHARDAEAAHDDLVTALQSELPAPPAGALLFTCNGRGSAMFGVPDHDSQAVVDAIGRPAVAGFFCGGEIGPVGGRSFLHGYTATMAVFLEDG